MSGDGLVPPLNAPPAGAPVPGVQPGTTSPVVIANIVIIFGPTGSATGLFVYQPGTKPAAGNPPIAWITANAVDPYGNTVQPGVMLAEAASSGNAEGGLIWNTATPGAAEPLLALFPNATVGFTGNSPFVLGRVFNRGLVNEQLGLALGGGGTDGTSPVQLEVLSASKDGTIPLNVQLFSPSGESWQVDASRTDSSTNPQTNIVTPSFGIVTKALTISANDAQVGTIYEVEVPFTGVHEGIQLDIGIDVGGVFTNVVPLLATWITTGHSFVGSVRMRMTFTATGVGGSANIDFDGTAGDSGVNRGPATSTALNGHTTLAINTTISHTVAIAVNWASTNASQSFTGFGSIFRRNGV